MAITSFTSKKLTSKNISYSIDSLTANTYATVISIQGSGFVNYLKFIFQVNSLSATFRITIDGVVFATGTTSTSTGVINHWTFNDATNPFQTGSLPTGYVFPYYKKSFLLEVRITTNYSNTGFLTGNTYYTIEE